MRRHLLILLCALMSIASVAARRDSLRRANVRGGWMRYTPVTQSLLADMHPHFVRLDVAAITNHSDYDYGQTGMGYHPTFVGNLAVNIPVYFVNFGARNKGQSVKISTPPALRATSPYQGEERLTRTELLDSASTPEALRATSAYQGEERLTRTELLDSTVTPPALRATSPFCDRGGVAAQTELLDSAVTPPALRSTSHFCDRGGVAEKPFAIAVNMPIHFQLWMDFLEPRTAAIVNTDYRFAMPGWTFLHRVNRGFLRNYAVSWYPFCHESTHIGDELALQRSEHGLPLRRVNVSYNWTELMFTINAEEHRLEQNHCLRVGLMVLFNPRAGWYFIDEREGDPTLARPRRSPWEAYLQYQYQSPARKGFQGVASVEIRNRALYGYPTFTWHEDGTIDYTIQHEKRVFTYNAFLGFRYNNLRYTGLGARFSAGVRIYHGNIPYGQFRNHNNINQFSLCLIVE